MPAHDGDRALPPATESPLLSWLLAALKPMPRTRIKQLLKHGQISVNGKPTKKFDLLLQAGDRVTVGRAKPEPVAPVLKRAGMPVIFSDDDLIVIDKPSGLLSVATDTEKAATAFSVLSECLAAQRRGRVFVVHRIDRDTSGLLMFARSEEVRDRLQATWEGVTKTYLAVVEGVPKPPEGVVQNYLTEGPDYRVRVSAMPGPEAKLAVTHYKVSKSNDRYSLVEVNLETGRKHQIRVHLSRLGCPIIGDKIYGATRSPAERLGLHAWRLEFAHPTTGRRIELESPLPDVLRSVV
jgi:23S rRNA pseudouridine1911/1915/1917 synthase